MMPLARDRSRDSPWTVVVPHAEWGQKRRVMRRTDDARASHGSGILHHMCGHHCMVRDVGDNSDRRHSPNSIRRTQLQSHKQVEMQSGADHRRAPPIQQHIKCWAANMASISVETKRFKSPLLPATSADYRRLPIPVNCVSAFMTYQAVSIPIGSDGPIS
jgi:hypothetical protein